MSTLLYSCGGFNTRRSSAALCVGGVDSVGYALTDNIHFALGSDVYTKGYDGKGDFASLHKISAVWLKGSFTW